jgi:hypothetical protein
MSVGAPAGSPKSRSNKVVRSSGGPHSRSNTRKGTRHQKFCSEPCSERVLGVKAQGTQTRGLGMGLELEARARGLGARGLL